MNKKKKKQLLRGTIAVAMSTTMLLPSFNQATYAATGKSYSKVEDYLASLTSAQRTALKTLQASDVSGLQLSPDVNLNSSAQTSIIVEFNQKPAVVAQLESKLEGGNLSLNEAQAKVDASHQEFKKDVQSLLSNKVNYQINNTYKNALNGVSMKLPANQIETLLKSKAVKAIYSSVKVYGEPVIKQDKQDIKEMAGANQSTSNQIPSINIDKLHEEKITGKGIKVAVIDTGIDYNHPDLRDAYKGGYDFVDNDSDPMETTYEDWKNSGEPELNERGSAYYTEHGSHVSGIIAGRGKNDSAYRTVGMAPDADIYVYRVLGPYGSGSSENVIAGIDRAVQEGMDVMNLSLGSAVNDPLIPESIAINNAVLAGVTAVVSAGNSGPNMYTLGSPGTAALALTVGASSLPSTRYSINTKLEGNGDPYTLNGWSQMAKGIKDNLTDLEGKSYEVVYAGLGAPGDFVGKDVKGKAVLISRGVYAFVDKIKNAYDAGAAVVLIHNSAANAGKGDINLSVGEGIDFLPTFTTSYENGMAMKAKLDAGSTQVTLSGLAVKETKGNTITDFSSRGPSRYNYDIKPEIVAPGESILSTVPAYISNHNDPTDYSFAYEPLSGTSMAAPNVAGAAALLLQANPGLEPEDVKTILMNTSDDLDLPYSVFEQGAGLMDPYEAIHSQLEVKVLDKTDSVVKNRLKPIKDRTGALSFGLDVLTDGNFTSTKSVEVKNRSEKAKTFNVSFVNQVGTRGSLDPAANGVAVSLSGLTTDANGKQLLTAKGISTKTIKASINVPSTAAKGIYEGYIVLTNKDNPAEEYQIPWSIRTVTEGFAGVLVLDPLVTSSTEPTEYYDPFASLIFQNNSMMRTIDFVVQDENGKDVGYLGQVDGYAIGDGATLQISNFFDGTYLKIEDNQITNEVVHAKPGHYKIKLVGTSEVSSKQTTTTDDFIVEGNKPVFETNLDAGIPIKEVEGTSTTISGKLFDQDIEDAKALGLAVSQSKNTLKYYVNGGAGKAVAVNSDGTFSASVTLPNQDVTTIRISGADAASNYAGSKTFTLVKKGSSYLYAQPSATSVQSGDSVNFAVTGYNLQNAKNATYKFALPTAFAAVNNVTAASGSAAFTTQTSGSQTIYTVNYNAATGQSLSGNEPLFTINVKVKDDDFTKNVAFDSQSASYTNASDQVVNLAHAGSSINVIPTFGKLTGNVKANAFTSDTGATKANTDYTKLATVTLKNSQGQSFNVSVSANGSFVATKLPASTVPYTLTVSVPGHFTYTQNVVVGEDQNGKAVGLNVSTGDVSTLAGDVNQDNVVDVQDAIYLQTYWATNKRAADINFDGKVDQSDMAYVVNNYTAQNPTATNPPKAKLAYKGKKLEDVLKDLGL
ncbi:S8 family serine peptidase [Bacillus sp. EAC]|uniref:S8 family serine peptidase n=1 Tax=Bacillus sp. EAC TaxID=1978338 RepID=UPI000B448046|nr:S8 family serine peptidase [Bacillus sp. EAC]